MERVYSYNPRARTGQNTVCKRYYRRILPFTKLFSCALIWAIERPGILRATSEICFPDGIVIFVIQTPKVDISKWRSSSVHLLRLIFAVVVVSSSELATVTVSHRRNNNTVIYISMCNFLIIELAQTDSAWYLITLISLPHLFLIEQVFSQQVIIPKRWVIRCLKCSHWTAV